MLEPLLRRGTDQLVDESHHRVANLRDDRTSFSRRMGAMNLIEHVRPELAAAPFVTADV